MSGPPTELLELVLVPLLFRRFVEDEGLAEAEALAEIHRQMGLTTTDSSSFASLATATGGASWRDSAAYLQQYLGATVAKLDTRWRACDACSATGSPWRGEPEASASERVAAGLAGPHGSCLGAKVDWVCELLRRDALLDASLCLASVVSAHGWARGSPWALRDDKEACLLHHAKSPRAAAFLLGPLRFATARLPPPAAGQPATNSHVLVNQRKRAGYTPLHRCPTASLAHVLLAAGADPNARTSGGMTPIFTAISAAVARVLLEAGADPCAVSSYGHSALHLAASNGAWEVVWLLLVGGCDDGVRGHDGRTALDLARAVLAGVPSGPVAGGGEEEGAPVAVARAPDGSTVGGGGTGGGGGGGLSFPPNAADIRKAVALLELWRSDDCGGDAEVFKRRCGLAAFGPLARDPSGALALATGLPLDCAGPILTDYVGIFTRARDLTDAQDCDGCDSDGGGVRDGASPLSSSPSPSSSRSSCTTLPPPLLGWEAAEAKYWRRRGGAYTRPAGDASPGGSPGRAKAAVRAAHTWIAARTTPGSQLVVVIVAVIAVIVLRAAAV